MKKFDIPSTNNNSNTGNDELNEILNIKTNNNDSKLIESKPVRKDIKKIDIKLNNNFKKNNIKLPKVTLSVRVSQEIVQQLENCVYYTNQYNEGYENISSILNDAIEDKLLKIYTVFNNGIPFETKPKKTFFIKK